MNRFLFTMICSFYIVSSVHAQVMLKIEGDVFDFSEAGAIITEEDDNVTVVLALEQMRPEVNKDLDIIKGDVIFMANGEKIKSVNQLKEIYQVLEIGEALKLAIKRDGKPLMLKVNKMHPDDLPRKVIKKELSPEEAKELDGKGHKMIIQKSVKQDESDPTRKEKDEE